MMRSNGREEFLRWFTPEYAATLTPNLDRVVSGLSDGTTVHAAAGGYLVELESAKVVDSTTVQAVGRAFVWSRVGQVDQVTGKVSWARPQGEHRVTVTLVQTDDGWRISNRSFDVLTMGSADEPNQQFPPRAS